MKFLREPLVHFIVLGAILFGVYVIGSDLLSAGDTRRIAITRSDIALLVGGFERRWQRPPTADELKGLVDSRVREEVLYREALTMRLDRDDSVVRRRMTQKMDLLSQDIALLADPTDAELERFFRENKNDYRIPPWISFSHVYFNMDKRGGAAEDDAQRVLAELLAGSPVPERAPDRGDPFMLAHDFTRVTPFGVRREFGAAFEERLFTLKPGWHGPLKSGFGLHLVHVLKRFEGRVPALNEIREALVRDYNRVRTKRARQQLYQGLAERYLIEIDTESLGLFTIGKAP
jgi:hypothetical protein